MSPRDVESREKVISHIARTEAQLWLRPNEVSFPEVVSQQSSLYGISEQNAEAASIAILHGLRAHKKKDVGQYCSIQRSSIIKVHRSIYKEILLTINTRWKHF